MSDLRTLREVEIARDGAQRRTLRGAIGAAVVIHAVALALLIWHPHRTLPRVTAAHPGSISAYVNVVPAPAGTTGAQRPVSKPRTVKLAPATAPPQDEPVSNESVGSGQTTIGQAQGGGPVRMSIGQIQLIKKVDPIYPPPMIARQSSGTVVLDATINPDGTIGDVKILQSQGDLFDRAAIKAVKQWRYTPPGFDAILTVTVIFSLR
jgi:TonB family protein